MTQAGQQQEAALTPTGRPSGADSQQLQPALQSAVDSIRQILRSTPSLRQANVQVQAQGGQVVLSGTVASEDMKEQVEDAAESAAPGIAYDNRITVQQR